MKIPFWLFFLVCRFPLLFKLYVHLVSRQIHLVEPALNEIGVVGFQLCVLLRQRRQFEVLSNDLVIKGLLRQSLSRDPHNELLANLHILCPVPPALFPLFLFAARRVLCFSQQPDFFS